jgi:hypothetical protein
VEVRDCLADEPCRLVHPVIMEHASAPLLSSYRQRPCLGGKTIAIRSDIESTVNLTIHRYVYKRWQLMRNAQIHFLKILYKFWMALRLPWLKYAQEIRGGERTELIEGGVIINKASAYLSL